MTRSLSLRARRVLTPRNLLYMGVAMLSGFLLLFAACSTSGAETIDHPTESADVLLRISTEGGFIPVEYSLTHIPEFTLFGDGTVIVTGPMIEIYPQPALPNLQTTSLSEEAVQKVLAAAKEAGLMANNKDYGQPTVADAATTTIVVNAEGQSYTSRIYALGFEQDAGQSLTTDQKKDRAAVSDFIARSFDLGVFQVGTTDWQEYEFAALAIYVMPIDPGFQDYSDVQPNRLDWPLVDLSALGEPVQPQGFKRLVVSGEDLKTLQPLLDQATQITLWISGDSEYHLYFRPLLPSETT